MREPAAPQHRKRSRPSGTWTAGRRRLIADARCVLVQVPWEESFGIVLTEMIACSTPLVAVRGDAVPNVVGGVTGPEACWRHAARNFGVGQFGSGYEKIDQEGPKGCR